jgi:hypothetical protein
MSETRWQDWVMAVLGIWFVLSPFILGYSGAAAINAIVFGVVIAALAVISLYQPRMWEEWVNLAIGVWLLIAPFALGFRAETVATANHVVIGLLIAADALSALTDFPKGKLISK